ncbi:hypothetical protein D3C87_1436080 [compost metagenome]
MVSLFNLAGMSAAYGATAYRFRSLSAGRVLNVMGTLLNSSPVALIRSLFRLGNVARSPSALASVIHRPRTYKSLTWENCTVNGGIGSSQTSSSNLYRACSSANGELRQHCLMFCATDALPPSMNCNSDAGTGSPTH